MQKVKLSHKTFAQVAESALAKILHEGAESERTDVTFDIHKDVSTKKAERRNRHVNFRIQFRSSIVSNQTIHHWRKLLSSASSQANLIKFLVDEWKASKHREKIDKTLHVTCEEVCFRIIKSKREEVVQLKSSQEEADTHRLLHAVHAPQTLKNIPSISLCVINVPGCHGPSGYYVDIAKVVKICVHGCLKSSRDIFSS